MAHLRYVKKDGKTYGPYSYKSIRTKDGKVKNIYLGKSQKTAWKGVVQKVFLVSAVLLLLLVIPFLKNEGTPAGLVALENKIGEQIGNYEIKQTEQGYNIEIRSEGHRISQEQGSKIAIEGLKEIPPKITAKIDLPGDNRIKTEIFAIEEELDFNNAILTLKKTGNIANILHCQNFNLETFHCNNWENTNIPFTDLGDYIQFEVTHFTAYAGGGTGDLATNLTIWDDTDSEGGSNKRYSEGCQIPVGCSSKIQTNFFANYTNNTGSHNQPINTSSSNCSISFHINLTSDDEASWTTAVNMTFNMDTEQYEYNKSFNYRGTYYHNTSCWDDDYDDNSTLDTFTVSNSEPYISDDPLPDLNCNEDEWCYLNFSDNCTDPDYNDADSLSYGINDTSHSCMWFDTSKGNLSIYCINETEVFSGDFQLTVTDSIASDAAVMRIIVSAVNDTPTFTLTNQTLNEDVSYEINLSEYYSDEENDMPYFRENNTEEGDPQFVNISYDPSPPYVLNGEIINMTPSNAEVGNYSLNITVNDTSGNEDSRIIIFDIVNVNDPPSLDWVCTDNDTNFSLTEDSLFTCAVNATDDDLIWGDNLTFTANETWFTFEWQSNNESNVSFTPNDEQVGFWWVNITVNDTGDITDSKLINITVQNVSDAPSLSEIGNFTAYVDVTYTFSINASDGDFNISDGGESLNFSINDTSLFTLGDVYIRSDVAYSDISFTPSSAKDYWINFSVNDTDGNTNSELVNLSIRGNSPPVLDATVNNNATEDIEFYINLTWNVTDDDGDEVTWSDNTTLFDINTTSGEINFTVNDSYVGENWVNITVTDSPPGANNSQVLNFTVYNVEDVPNFTEPIGNYTAYEDSEFYLVINATDEDFYIPEGNILGISERLTFEVNDTSLFSIVQDDTTNATINFTAVNNSQAGLYWFEINVTDTTGLVYNETINITVIEVNDAPQFTDFNNITNATQNTQIYYDFAASDEENGTDTADGVDSNLTFWIANITNATDGNLVDSITLTYQFFDDTNEALNSTTGVLSFTPNATHAGTGVGNRDYKVNISVNDSDGAMDSVIVNVSIRNENDAPVINCALLTASGFSNAVEITMYENDTNMTFSVTGVEDADGDILIFNWTLNDIVNESNSQATSLSGGSYVAADSWSYYPGFNDSGVHNLTLLIFDGTNISTATNSDYSNTCFRNITVLELNSPPQFLLTIQNISWNQDTTYTNLDLDDYFSDIENQTELNFTYDKFNGSLDSLSEADSQITVEINNDTHIVTLTPVSSWYGSEYIQFHANDSLENVSSNYVYLNVTQAEVTAAAPAAPAPSAAGGGVRKKLVTIDIIHPKTLTLLEEEILVSPVIIRNTNTVITLRDIDIEAESSSEGITLILSETHIDSLAPGEEKEILLSMLGAREGIGDIIIKAIVHNPEVMDSAKILATIVGMPRGIEEKIKFVKDLFKENPECLELNEFVKRAEEAVAANRYDAALDNINIAIDKCKDLISVVYTPEEKLLKKINIKRVLSLSILNIISIAFIIFVIKKLRKKRG